MDEEKKMGFGERFERSLSDYVGMVSESRVSEILEGDGFRDCLKSAVRDEVGRQLGSGDVRANPNGIGIANRPDDSEETPVRLITERQKRVLLRSGFVPCIGHAGWYRMDDDGADASIVIRTDEECGTFVMCYGGEVEFIEFSLPLLLSQMVSCDFHTKRGKAIWNAGLSILDNFIDFEEV